MKQSPPNELRCRSQSRQRFEFPPTKVNYLFVREAIPCIVLDKPDDASVRGRVSKFFVSPVE